MYIKQETILEMYSVALPAFFGGLYHIFCTERYTFFHAGILLNTSNICFQFWIVQMPNNDKLYITGGKKTSVLWGTTIMDTPPYISVSAYIYNI